ncbi:MAG: hypothetical protein MUC50_13660 [Myxococcota bacterium]|jgi:tetratricopeptide (TPR) repeat protein|nr:hypothetical protein [Myxococcota bacterium]
MTKTAFLIAVIFAAFAAPTKAQSSDVAPKDTIELSLPEKCPLGKVQGSMAHKAAGNWFARGELLVAEEKYEDAVAAFMCSFKLVEHPNTLFNTAQAALLLGNTEMALQMLHKYTAEVPDGPMATDVAARIAELEHKRAKSLPQPEEPALPGVVLALPVVVKSVRPEKPNGHRPLGIAAIGLSGAMAVTGVVLHSLAGVAQSEGTRTDDLSVFQEQRDKMNSFQTSAIVCYGVGALALAAGIVLLVLDKPERPTQSAAVDLSASGTSVSLEF